MTRHTPIAVFLMLLCLVLGMAGTGNLVLSSEAMAAAKTEFPTKPVSMVVPFQAGGGTDVVGRMIAHAMDPFLGNKVIVLNKPGGAGIAGIQEVVFAKPDGYTILFTTGTPIIQTYVTKKRVDYRQLVLLGIMNKDYFATGVAKNSKWATFDDFIQDAKRNPGKIRVGHPGAGTTQHLTLPSLEKSAGVKFQPVPFAGNHPSHIALLGGHLEACQTLVCDADPLVKSGDMRLLAVAAETRLKEYPDVPTYKEKGVEIGISHWRGIWASKETPEPILAILEEAIRKASNSQGYKDMMIKSGYIPENLVDRAKIKERLEIEDRSIKEALKSLNMLEE
jgi:tripartite-type tricarboxylate transporter receptor subunit TctC